jgi:hypothetical protein
MSCTKLAATCLAGFGLIALETSALGAELAWHARAPELLGTATPFTGVAYGQGIFVAVIYDGRIAVSTDGVIWETSTPGSAVPWMSVGYAASRFLVVGWPTNLVSSTDGTNWEAQTWPDIDATATGLSSSGNRFWLGTKSGLDQDRTLYASTTATNWVRSAEEFFSSLAMGQYLSVASGGGLYVCVGWDTCAVGSNPFYFTPTILISADRTNWITELTGVDPTTPPWIRDGTALRRVTYGDNLFVAVGSSTITGKNIWYSSDGTNWTYEVTSFPSLSSVAYGDGAYAAVGGYDNVFGIPGVILTSTDGRQWRPAQIASTNTLRDVVYGHNTFVAVGDYGQIFQSDPVVTLKATDQTGQLIIRGPLGRTCTIEATETLKEINLWQPVGTTAITNDPMLWTDFTALGVTNRFYRARLEPQMP